MAPVEVATSTSQWKPTTGNHPAVDTAPPRSGATDAELATAAKDDNEDAELEYIGPEDVVDFEGEADPLPEQAYHDAARHYLDAQIGSFDVLDTRAVQIFSVGSAALPLTAALINLGSGEIDVPRCAVWALVAALIVYGGLLGSVIKAAWVPRLEYKPQMDALQEYSLYLPGVALMRWIGDEYVNSTNTNRQTLDRKSRWVGLATFALYAEGVLLAVAAILILL